MSQTPDRLQSEIFKRKPYLRNYFLSTETSPHQLQLIPTKIQKLTSEDVDINEAADLNEPADYVTLGDSSPMDSNYVAESNYAADYVSLGEDSEVATDLIESADYVSLGDSSEIKKHTTDGVSSSDDSEKTKISDSLKKICHYVKRDKANLASSYDSYTQAERNFKTQSPGDRDLVILLGLGNPEIIRYSNSKIPPNQVLIAIDETEAMVPLLWDSYLQDFATVPGRHIFCGERFVGLLWNYFDGLPIERISGIKIIRNSQSIDINPDFYQNVEERILATFSAKMSDLLTKFEFETLWTSNILRNTIRYFHSGNNFLISDYRDKLIGVPALLVSAGPSLRNNLDFIHKNRNKFFIMSCDTSLKVLQKSNIIPDGIYTLDAQMNSIFHFLGEDITNIPLFADMVSAPYLLDTINPQSVIFSMTAKYTNDAAGNLNREVTAGGEFAQEWIGDVGDIQSGGSVATTAFDALRFMGCTEIFFIGQDLAYTGREIHSTGTHHNEKWLGLINRKNSLERINEVVVRKRDTRYVESITGSQVLTDYVLDLYRHWFEESASSLNNMQLVNIGIHGAKISGMKNLQPTKVDELLKDKPTHNFPWRNWDPWQIAKFSNSKSDSETKSKDPAIVIYNDIIEILNKIVNWRNSDDYSSEIESWFQTRSYLRRLYRKTEVYLLRHRDKLDPVRKKKLTLDTIEREFKKLKRKIYPMMKPDFFSKNNLSSS